MLNSKGSITLRMSLTVEARAPKMADPTSWQRLRHVNDARDVRLFNVNKIEYNDIFKPKRFSSVSLKRKNCSTALYAYSTVNPFYTFRLSRPKFFDKVGPFGFTVCEWRRLNTLET